MTEQEQIEADQYRFSGYNLELIILDETGPSYAVARPHPYYYNQPAYWQKNAYQNGQIVGGNIRMEQSGAGVPQYMVSDNPNNNPYSPIIFPMLSF